MPKATDGPRILFIDIETKPMLSYTWGIWDQNVGLNQIKEDWSVLSWAAKRRGFPKIHYQDLSKAKSYECDKALLKGIWELLDWCDVAVGHNLDRFDVKKLNARFLKYGMEKPSSFKTIDTLKLAKANFALTSNKLEYLANYLGLKDRKLTHRRFSGFDLWSECLKGNQAAWREMRAYNKQDVTVLEAVYDKLQPWGLKVNFNLYSSKLESVCPCGSESFKKNGVSVAGVAVYQRYRCTKCGAESRDGENLLAPDKRKALRR